jgi:hypothetical protein
MRALTSPYLSSHCKSVESYMCILRPSVMLFLYPISLLFRMRRVQCSTADSMMWHILSMSPSFLYKVLRCESTCLNITSHLQTMHLFIEAYAYHPCSHGETLHVADLPSFQRCAHPIRRTSRHAPVLSAKWPPNPVCQASTWRLLAPPQGAQATPRHAPPARVCAILLPAQTLECLTLQPWRGAPQWHGSSKRPFKRKCAPNGFLTMLIKWMGIASTSRSALCVPLTCPTCFTPALSLTVFFGISCSEICSNDNSCVEEWMACARSLVAHQRIA